MQIRVNGEPRELDENSSLSALVSSLILPSERIAIELNNAVVRRNEWEPTILRDGDRVEIVHFVGGGNRNEQG